MGQDVRSLDQEKAAGPIRANPRGHCNVRRLVELAFLVTRARGLITAGTACRPPPSENKGLPLDGACQGFPNGVSKTAVTPTTKECLAVTEHRAVCDEVARAFCLSGISGNNRITC